ncbi:GlxA family transcriptional regulator [Paraconexibacter sp.]|uniref:GlxA family transcriptional regulator n=1 Tax=Paraconexibacter sp. TaxID=2949640 RepID=UPI003561F59E
MVPVHVTALALDGVLTFDLGCAVQAFSRGPGRDGAPAGFTMSTCGLRPGPVRTPDGFDLHVSDGLEALASADVVVIPGVHPVGGPVPDDVVVAIQAAHARGAIVMSICVGAFVLAQTGLLDGRPATTHWHWCEDLAARHPDVDVRPDVLYVDDGDILTSAGLAAGLDLCLHLVRREAGAAAATRLASWNVVAPHREGGQAQFIAPPPRPDPDGLPGSGIGPTLAWAHDHLHEPLTLAQLAREACMSERTFSRRFRAEVGVSPKQWLLAQRVGRARELLETTDLPVEVVAERAGFASAPALRLHLRRHAATTPTAYRTTFRDRAVEPRADWFSAVR